MAEITVEEEIDVAIPGKDKQIGEGHEMVQLWRRRMLRRSSTSIEALSIIRCSLLISDVLAFIASTSGILHQYLVSIRRSFESLPVTFFSCAAV